MRKANQTAIDIVTKYEGKCDVDRLNELGNKVVDELGITVNDNQFSAIASFVYGEGVDSILKGVFKWRMRNRGPKVFIERSIRFNRFPNGIFSLIKFRRRKEEVELYTEKEVYMKLKEFKKIIDKLVEEAGDNNPGITIIRDGYKHIIEYNIQKIETDKNVHLHIGEKYERGRKQKVFPPIENEFD